MKIKKIEAREILDSRGFPTVECSVLLENNQITKASVPSGASVGKYEAVELRDGDAKRYFGKGVLKAIENIEKKIAPVIVGKEANFQEIDKIIIDLDGTSNKANLGANSTLAVSMAVCRAQALSERIALYELINEVCCGGGKILLPDVMFNILNGGVHADNTLSFQEFMIMPVGQNSFAEKLQMAVVVYQNLKKLLKQAGYSTNVGDEGGFAPKFGQDTEIGEKKALEFLIKAVELSGFDVGKDVVFCLDVAASQFYDEENKVYTLGNKKLGSDEMILLYDELLSTYPIYSIEDGLDEQDWDGWKSMTEKIGARVQLVGDDIFVTNSELIKKGTENHVANAALIKPNQIGTVTQTLEAIKLCKDSNYKTVVSHRSGETMDTFISDLVVGTAAGQFKAGAPARGERVAKYNRLLEIEGMLED